MSSQLARTSQTQTDSDEEDQHPRAPGDAGAEIARLKRRLRCIPKRNSRNFRKGEPKSHRMLAFQFILPVFVSLY